MFYAHEARVGSRAKSAAPASANGRERPVDRADEDHFFSIAEKLGGGRLIPFLGAGANLCDRGDEAWEQGRPFLPSGSGAREPSRRARALSRTRTTLTSCASPSTSGRREARTSSTSTCARCSTRTTPDVAAPAARARRARARDAGLPQLLVRDDELRRPRSSGRSPRRGSSTTSSGTRRSRTRLRHGPLRAPCAGRRSRSAIARPNKYTGLPMVLERPAILKLHGCSIRESAEDDSYVITEDSYIDYLSRRRRRRADPDRAVAAADEQQPALPRLLAERLEPARDPQPDLGRRASSSASRGRCSASRPTRT